MPWSICFLSQTFVHFFLNFTKIHWLKLFPFFTISFVSERQCWGKWTKKVFWNSRNKDKCNWWQNERVFGWFKEKCSNSIEEISICNGQMIIYFANLLACIRTKNRWNCSSDWVDFVSLSLYCMDLFSMLTAALHKCERFCLHLF